MKHPVGVEDEYECAMCHQTYKGTISAEECEKETIQFFGKQKLEDLEVICDDCWKKIHPERN